MVDILSEVVLRPEISESEVIQHKILSFVICLHEYIERKNWYTDEVQP